MYQTIIYKDFWLNNAKNLFSLLDEKGSLFLFTNNKYNESWFIEHDIFDILQKYLDSWFSYVNTIVYPIKNEKNSQILNHNISYIFWLVKDINKMFFDKDKIREKHIWKDVEWWKRAKNYNPLWKDPWNVWIPTIDDWKWKITHHLLMNIEEIINRCIESTYIKDWRILINFSDINIKTLFNNENIDLNKEGEFYNFIQLKLYKWSNILKSVPDNIYWEIHFKSSENMKNILDNSIDLMVTSPPYWDLKNYFKEWQIWQESYQEYLDRMWKVWSETHKKLKESWSMWININIRTKNKKPILIPNDIIKQCKKIWFYLKDIVIWHKSSWIPTHKNNIVDKFEFFLWFVKDKNYKANNINFWDYKNEDLNNWLIWNINRKAWSVWKDFIHPAVYPNELIDRVINLCSNEWDVVLEPFLWSGTTLISALNNDRSCISYEFNEWFLDLIKYRIKNDLNINKNSIKYFLINKNINKESTIFRN